MLQIRNIVAVALLSVVLTPAAANAQVIVSDPIVEQAAPQAVKNQWQTYLETVQVYQQDYQQLQIMIQNARSFSFEDWVNIGSQAQEIAASIKAQMSQPYGSAMAGAAAAQNQYLQQDVNVLTTIAGMAPNAAGSAQRQQLTNELLMAIASENLKQRELRLAQAQDDARREQLWQEFQAQDASH